MRINQLAVNMSSHKNFIWNTYDIRNRGLECRTTDRRGKLCQKMLKRTSGHFLRQKFAENHLMMAGPGLLENLEAQIL